MRALRRKLGRDLWRDKWQILAVVAVTLMGTAGFVATYLSYQDLRDSYQDTQVRLRLADMTLDVAFAEPRQAEAVAGLEGVAAATTQVVVDLPLIVPDGRQQDGEPGRVQATARLIGIPLGDEAPVNPVRLEEGTYPAQPGEVLVERHFTAWHGIRPGDTLVARSPAGSEVPLKVSGVGIAAEFLWVSRSKMDSMPPAAEFGVIFVPSETLAAMPGLGALVPAGSANRLLYLLEPGADPASVLAAVKKLLGPETVTAATPRAKLTGIDLLQQDVDGMKEMAVAFPLIFLTVAVFIVASLMSRKVDQERTIVATMMALGLRRRAVLGHYASYALVIGILGSVLGCGLGLVLAKALVVTYAAELHIPFVTVRTDYAVLGIGFLMGVAAPVLAGMGSARRAASLVPAQAMRPFSVAVGRQPGRGRSEETAGRTPYRTRRVVGRLPLWLRLALRDLGRQRGRTWGTVVGVALALTIIITAAGVIGASGTAWT